jgi:hypothetical protein
VSFIHPIQFGESVTLLRTSATGVDDYGNDVITDAEIVIADVAVWPRTSSESTGESDSTDRAQTIIGLTLLIPPGVDVHSTDRFSVRGQTYEVDGEPGVWRSYLTDTRAGTQVFLTRVEG